jgi:uncharacterized protein (TIGR02001 family)
MKKIVLSVVAALALSAAPAFAADMPVKAMKAPVAAPSPFDILFGAALQTDYVLRGVSQSNRKPSVNGYVELDYTLTDWVKIYAGIHGYSLWYGFADAEFDLSGGARFSWGNFGLDLGYVYYDYPDGVTAGQALNLGTGVGNGSFGEFYAIPTYKFNDWLTVGGVVDGGNNFNNKVSTAGTAWVGDAKAGYYSGNAVITLPWKPIADVTISINPEIGRQWFSSSVNANIGSVSYTYYDVGLDFAWKAATLDLRYWNTSLSGAARNNAVGTNVGGPTFVATLKFDTSFSQLK